LREVAKRHRQTDKRRVKHNFLGGGKTAQAKQWSRSVYVAESRIRGRSYDVTVPVGVVAIDWQFAAVDLHATLRVFGVALALMMFWFNGEFYLQ